MRTITKYVMGGLLAASMTFFSSCEQKEIQLPENAAAFMNDYFPDAEIRKIEKEGGKYEVKMQNDMEVDFNKNGEWTKVDCRKEAVPLAVIPTAIASYLEENYPGIFVKEIEIINGKYEVDLSNGTDLIFNKAGEFVKVEK